MTLSAQIFRVIGKSLKAQGIFPTEDNILTTGELSCSIQDKVSGNTMALFERVKCADTASDVTARGLVSTNATFNCVRMKDEFERPIG